MLNAIHIVTLAALGALLAGCASTPDAASSTEAADPGLADPDARPTFWIIGDSTVKNGGAEGEGWGEVIHEHFDTDRITIHNRAIGGRSSRTFRTDGRWEEILKVARPGDFVIMQFGHNDPIEPDNPHRPRGTIRGTGDEYVDIIHPHTGDPERVYTFGWYMRKYVTEAKEKGMIPIVCSYIPRAPRRGETPNPELSSYGLYAKTVADEEDAAFIDLYGKIATAYIPLEKEHPHTVKETFFVGGDRDYTHTNEAGARFNAELVVEGIREIDKSDPASRLAKYLKKD